MASVIRVSILGAMPGGEVWSVNPCWFLLDEPANISGSEAQAIATAVAAIVVPVGLTAVWSPTTSVTGARVEARDRNGILEAMGEAAKVTPTVGTGTSVHPYQTSTVTSLRTTFPGGQGRGRLYWPATGITMDATNLRLAAGTVTSLLAGVKSYLALIEAAVAVSAGEADLTVWSRTGTAFHAVTSIRQGNVLDTQRRRRDALSEAYQELTYP